MTPPTPTATDEAPIRQLLTHWAHATQKGLQDEILRNHASDVLIYDVLPPMQYQGAAAYRQSWDEWQPQTQGEGQFTLEDLCITAGQDVAFAHGLIRCRGTLADGTHFQDLVRATFCVQKKHGAWQVAHQHISKPFQPGGGA